MQRDASGADSRTAPRGVAGGRPAGWKWQPERNPYGHVKRDPGLACQHLNPASSERGGARVAHRRVPAATDSNREPAVPVGSR